MFSINMNPILISSPKFSTPFTTLKYPISCTIKRERDRDRDRDRSKAKPSNQSSLTDEILSVELNLEIGKLNSRAVEREEALNKSTQILFSEMCNFAGLNSEDFNKKWRKMSEEERSGLARGFLKEWSSHLHPLSATSVLHMVDEYLTIAFSSQSPPPPPPPTHNGLIPGFTKFFGFIQH